MTHRIPETDPARPTALVELLTPQQQSEIDASVAEWLDESGAPSVSVAVVARNEIAYAKAYGNGRATPARRATLNTRYPIASVSKQFTAAAVLTLQEQGVLSLEDRVSKYFPDLANADDVTLRQILSHTAGYRDYWPQSFVPLRMTRPISLRALLDDWVRTLDFPPGTDWQYSNTGFVVAGAIVEKATGQRLVSYLRSTIFDPLGMRGVLDADQSPLALSDAAAYTRFGDGPIRPAPKEGAGWMFAAGGLAMAPQELARWDISLMARTLLSATSYDALYSPIELSTGKSSEYSLGLFVRDDGGRLQLDHGGGASGFLAANKMWPNEKVAVVAFTNNDWADPGTVADRIAYVVLPPQAPEARARAIFQDFQNGLVDRSQFSEIGNAFLTPAVLADQRVGLARFGPARLFKLEKEVTRGGLKTRIWRIVTSTGALNAVERTHPDGKVEQFIVSRG